MQNTTTVTLLAVLLVLTAATVQAADPDKETDPRVLQARKTAKEFGSRLVNELDRALREGGPANAIQVCNVEAPRIAAALSEQQNWTVGRTALKTRNPKNRPDQWEKSVLQTFEQRKQGGEDMATLEHYEETEKAFRYMKAIPTKELCLTCHGSSLADPVKTKLKQLYPQDKATGFNAGDIRGAFTITQKQTENKK